MILILDTNVIRADWMMKSGKFEIILDFATKTRSQFVLTRIVNDELRALYERELKSRNDKFVEAKRSLESIITTTRLPEYEGLLSLEADEYMACVYKTLSINPDEIFEYKETYLHDVVERAIRRRRPCSDRGEEMRDAILWHSVLDIAFDSFEKEVVFISQNIKQFAAGDKNLRLHPDLADDCKNRGVVVDYFDSLDSFAAKHAVKIDFLTEDWLTASLDSRLILDKAESIIERDANRRIESTEIKGVVGTPSSTGYFNRQTDTLDIDDFYVYEMSDQSLRVMITYYGEVEVECEVEVVVEKDDIDYEHEYDPWTGQIELIKPIIRHRKDIDVRYLYVYPDVQLQVEALVRNNQIESWRLLDV